MKKHFITGGTGYIGRHLVKALVARGDEVFILARQSQPVFAKSSNLSILVGDITKNNLGLEPSELKKLRRAKIDFVWHLAANLTFSQSSSLREKFLVNVVGTENVLRLAGSLGAVLCHFSTAFVAGDSKVFSEKDLDVGQKFRNDYEKTKFLAEKLIREKARCPYIIFRPSFVIGRPNFKKASQCTFGYYRYLLLFYLFGEFLKKDLRTNAFFGIIKKLFGISVANSGKTTRLRYLVLPYPKGLRPNVVSVDYVVRTAIRTASNESALGKTIHLTHSHEPSLTFITNSIFRGLAIRGIKYVALNSLVFKSLVYLVYFLAIPWRGYIKSGLLYLPYISSSTKFIRKNVNLYNHEPKAFSKRYFDSVNREAFKDIFPGVVSDMQNK